MIDRKYEIYAVNPCNGHIHDERDSILFTARDKAVPAMLLAYIEECKELGCDETHLKSISLLRERVVAFQEHHGSKIPDTTGPCETARCINGDV